MTGKKTNFVFVILFLLIGILFSSLLMLYKYYSLRLNSLQDEMDQVPQTTPLSSPTIKPLSETSIRSICSKRASAGMKDILNSDDKLSKDDILSLINIAYRLCLTEYGMKPEDLVNP